MARVPTNQVIIDGNNLLYAMHAHAPVPAVGRETMVQTIARWAKRASAGVTIVFDGPPPPAGLGKQMRMRRVLVLFSAPLTADEVIGKLVKQVKDPGATRVVTSDTAVRYEAKRWKCQHVDSVTFVHEIFEGNISSKDAQPKVNTSEKPEQVSAEEAEEWLNIFGAGKDGDEDGFDVML